MHNDTPLIVDALIGPEERRLPSPKSRLWLFSLLSLQVHCHKMGLHCCVHRHLLQVL